MKHSSHQIRGKCTLHFVLEPGIAGERVASAVSQSPPAAAASLAPFGGPRTAAGADVNGPFGVLVLGDLKMIDLDKKSF